MPAALLGRIGLPWGSWAPSPGCHTFPGKARVHCVFTGAPAQVRTAARQGNLHRQESQVAAACYTAAEIEAGNAMMQVHHVHKRLPLKSVALGDGGTYIVIYEDGASAWSAGLPYDLYGKLASSIEEGTMSVAYAAMGRIKGSDTYSSPADGGEEVWFLREDNGTTWLGNSCDETLRNVWWGGTQNHRVEDVHFAPSNGWFVLKAGGGARWSGLPDSLEDALNKYWHEEAGVKSLSVGHNGEWFVKYGTGAFWWCGVHPVLDRLLEHWSQLTGNPEWVELGPDGSFVALFERYTAWYGDEKLTDVLLSAAMHM